MTLARIDMNQEHEQTLNGADYSPTDNAPPPGWEDVASASALAEANTPDEKPETFMHVVTVKFTESELHQRLDELKEARARREVLEDEKKAAAKAHKKQEKLCERLTEETTNKEGAIEVECFERRIFATNTVEIVRVSNGEVVERKAMLGEERQAELFADNGNGERFSTDTGEYVDGDAGIEADDDSIEDPEAVLSAPAPSPSEQALVRHPRSRKAKASS